MLWIGSSSSGVSLLPPKLHSASSTPNPLGFLGKFFSKTLSYVSMIIFHVTHAQVILWHLFFLGKIKELFSKEAIDDSTVLVLVNAVYFKAKWEKEFDCENTVDAPFSLSEVLTVLGCGLYVAHS